MKLECMLVGVLSILAAIFILSCPGSGAGTFLIVWTIIVAQLISGIVLVISYFRSKKQKMTMAIGVGTLVLGVALVVLAIMALFSEQISSMLMILVAIFFVASLVVHGVSMIFIGASHSTFFPAVTIVLGVLMLLLGIEGLCSIFFAMDILDKVIAIGLLFNGFAFLFRSERTPM